MSSPDFKISSINQFKIYMGALCLKHKANNTKTRFFSSEMTCCCFILLPNNSQGRCSSLFFNIWDKNSSNTVSFLATYLPWENRQHFVMPVLVSQQNDIWETSREIPYWWCVTTQIWEVILIGWKFASSNQKHNQDLGSVSQTLFSGESINGVIKCWLFSRVTTTTYAA